MLQHRSTVESLQHVARGRICARCDSPRKTRVRGVDAVRSCEADCPLFRLLPHLQEIVACMDPSLRECEPTLTHAIERAHERLYHRPHARQPQHCPLCRYSQELVRAICELVP